MQRFNSICFQSPCGVSTVHPGWGFSAQGSESALGQKIGWGDKRKKTIGVHT